MHPSVNQNLRHDINCIDVLTRLSQYKFQKEGNSAHAERLEALSQRLKAESTCRAAIETPKRPKIFKKTSEAQDAKNIAVVGRSIKFVSKHLKIIKSRSFSRSWTLKIMKLMKQLIVDYTELENTVDSSSPSRHHIATVKKLRALLVPFAKKIKGLQTAEEKITVYIDLLGRKITKEVSVGAVAPLEEHTNMSIITYDKVKNCAILVCSDYCKNIEPLEL